MLFNWPEFSAFMAEQGFGNPNAIADHLGVNRSITWKLSKGQRPSIDFIALLWVKYPRVGAKRFLITEDGQS